METTVRRRRNFHISDKVRRVVVDIICYLYILLFVYAAISKLIDFKQSVIQMQKSPLISDYAEILIYVVPFFEVVAAILLSVPRLVMYGLYLSFTIMLGFTVYIYAIINYSDTIPCSCGGILSALGWTEHFIFNVVFIILAMIGILLKSNK